MIFSAEFLRRSIRSKTHCLICGQAMDENAADFEEVTDLEHVFPAWIIKLCSESRFSGVLPNGQFRDYSRRKIRCHENCNKLWKTVFEDKVSKWFKEGYANFYGRFSRPADEKCISLWMLSIFCKQQIFDLQTRFYPNPKESDEHIGDAYDLDLLAHHLNILHSYCHDKVTEMDFDGFSICMPTIEPTDVTSFGPELHVQEASFFLRIGEVQVVSLFDHCTVVQKLVVNHANACGVTGKVVPEFVVAEVFAVSSLVRRMVSQRCYGVDDNYRRVLLRRPNHDLSYREFLECHCPILWGHYFLLFCAATFIEALGKLEYFEQVVDNVLNGDLRFLRDNETFMQLISMSDASSLEIDQREKRRTGDDLRARITNYLSQQLSSNGTVFV